MAMAIWSRFGGYSWIGIEGKYFSERIFMEQMAQGLKAEDRLAYF